MFPGLEFHANQLCDRANLKLDRSPDKPYASRLVWCDLGMVDVVVPGTVGYLTLSLDQMILHASIVKEPLDESPFAWLYKELDAQQEEWTRRMKRAPVRHWIQDEKEMLCHFEKPYPAFTMGLNYGLYLKIECVSAIMTLECSIVKGIPFDYAECMRHYELGKIVPAKLDSLQRRPVPIDIVEQAMRHVHDKITHRERKARYKQQNA